MKQTFRNHLLKALIYTLAIVGSVNHASYAQVVPAPQQVSPLNGSPGNPGAVSNSFIIKWDTVPNAAYYEWVISDNHLCFKGCAGDTRQQTTLNTSAISYNFPPNKWYYWIVRAILNNGDTTASSPISSFRTESSGADDLPYITISLDATNDKVGIGIEWAIQPDVKELTYDVVSEAGQKIITDGTITLKKDPAIRQEWFPISVALLQAGTYYFVFTTEFKKQIVKKVVII